MRGVPYWKAAIVTAGLCLATHAWTYSTRPSIERIVYRDKPYTVEYQTVVHETLPVPVCAGLPVRKFKPSTIDTLAAAIPASALGRNP